MKMVLGEVIKQARQKMFLTQDEFASELKVSISTVKRWELNKAKPNIKGMKAIKSFCKENGQSYEFIEKQWFGYSEEENE